MIERDIKDGGMSKIFFLSLVIAVGVAVTIISLVQFCRSTLAHQVDTKNPAYFYRPAGEYPLPRDPE